MDKSSLGKKASSLRKLAEEVTAAIGPRRRKHEMKVLLVTMAVVLVSEASDTLTHCQMKHFSSKSWQL